MAAGTEGSKDLRIFVYARCATCRKAIAWLDRNGIPFHSLDITATPPSTEELRSALQQLGSRSRLFNTSGQSYRALGSATVKAMEDDTALAALAADGKLIKRPFLITAQGRILTGFHPPEWEDLLISPPGS